jgi:uncharacterized protein (TIGR00255 family)
MLRSMTGFGKAEATIGTKKFTVEVRSLNSKQLDLNMRLPSVYREKELDLRTWLSENIQRGKADSLIYYESMEAEKRMAINKPLMVSYYQDLKEVADKAGMENADFMNALIRIPDVMKPESQEIDEEEWGKVFKLVEEAYKRFDQYRSIEGDKLKAEFELRIALILKLREDLKGPLEIRAKRVKDKLRNSLEEVIPVEKIDPNRFEQELIYYLDRLDISDEYQRLLTNCEHFQDELKGEASGKKLGFISQEIGREINTIGSKANDSDMQKIVVQMKDELEKIKEQINNVL